MKKTEFIIITIITIAYVIFSFNVSSVITFNNNKLFFAVPNKDGLALIGAFVAFYNVFWNLYKYIREKIEKSISISGIPTFDNGDIEIQCSFVNNSEYPISIDFCFLKGISFDFESIKIEEKGNLIKKIKGKRTPAIKLGQNIFGKSNINFQYRYLNKLSKYKNKVLKVEMKCIE